VSDPDEKLFRAVILRAICDALGFTNVSKKKEEHKRAVQEAREWFYENGPDFRKICEWADFDHDKVRTGVVKLIEARQSGDHSEIPDYWREAFRTNRMPSFTAFAEAIDNQLKRG
jgi:hypothetical protein